MKSKDKVRYITTLSMLTALLIVMSATGIGFIPLPLIKATTMHIPVIIGAVLLGPKAGAFLGGVFGMCSIVVNSLTPSIISFAFSPFMSTTGIWGAVKAVWIALGCRILFGLIAGLLAELCKKVKLHNAIALPITAAVSTICHTMLVMGSIYILLAQQYAEAKNVALSAVFSLVMGTVATSGIPEAIAAAILVTAIGLPLISLVFKAKKR